MCRLQAAEAEAQRGSSGSRAIRAAALQALQHLLSAVAGGTAGQQPCSTAEAQQAADTLAFFLPGIAVGLCKALLLSAASSGSGGGGRARTGPAASSTAAVAAVQAFVVLLAACLGDAAVELALHGSGAGGAGSSSTGAASSAWQLDADMGGAGTSAGTLEQAMQQLEMLSQRAQSSASSSRAPPTPAPAAPAAAAAQAPVPSQQQGGRMRVERSAGWVQDSAERLHQLLTTALPPLLAHQRPAVREAVVQGGAPPLLCCWPVQQLRARFELTTCPRRVFWRSQLALALDCVWPP